MLKPFVNPNYHWLHPCILPEQTCAKHATSKIHSTRHIFGWVLELKYCIYMSSWIAWSILQNYGLFKSRFEIIDGLPKQILIINMAKQFKLFCSKAYIVKTINLEFSCLWNQSSWETTVSVGGLTTLNLWIKTLLLIPYNLIFQRLLRGVLH